MKKRHLKYVELHEIHPIDWNIELNKTELSVAKTQKLTKHSGDWITCACGNLCEIIPRDEEGKPKDETLALLGHQFHFAICEQHYHIRDFRTREAGEGDMNKEYPADLTVWEAAKRILASIEKRANEILDQMIADEIERNGTVEL